MTTNIQLFDLKDIQAARAQRNALLAEFEEVVEAYMLGVDSDTTPDVDGRPGFVWVREFGVNGGVYQAFNPNVTAAINMPVLVGRQVRKPWRWMVIMPDWDTLVNLVGWDGNPYLPLHHLSHEWPDYTPGTDPVTVYPRAIFPLRTHPGVGLSLSVNPLRYDFDGQYLYFPGTTDFDISAYVPASGNAVYILVYYDPEISDITILVGDEVVDSVVEDAPYPDLPEGVYPSAVVRLISTTTEITEADITPAILLLNKTEGVHGYIKHSLAEQIGQVLISMDGESFEAKLPVTDPAGGWLVDDVSGLMIVT